VAFSFDGGKLFAGGYRGTIQVWNVDHAGRLRAAGSIRGHARPVTCLVTSPAARFVLSGSAAGELIWQAYDKPSQESRALAAFERPVLAVHLPQSGMAAWATDGRRLIQFDLRNTHITKTYELGRLAARAAAFSTDGAQLAMSLGRSIGLWDTQTGAEIMTLPAFGESQWSVAFLPDGGGLVSGGRGKATLWRLADGQPVVGVDLGGVLYIKALAVTKDGTLLAAIPSSAGQTLSVARLPDPEPAVDP
jgi:WD40 repeat protein